MLSSSPSTVYPVPSLYVVSFTKSSTFLNLCSPRDGWVSVFLKGQVNVPESVTVVLVALSSLNFWCLVSLGLWPWQQVIQSLPLQSSC